MLETHVVRPFYSFIHFILLCIQKKILIVSVRLPQRNLNVEASKIARKAVAVRAKSTAAIESPGTIDSGTLAGRSEDLKVHVQLQKTRQDTLLNQKTGNSEADAPASQVEVSQMRRSSLRNEKSRKMVVANRENGC